MKDKIVEQLNLDKQSQRDKLKELMRLDEKDGLYSDQLEPEKTQYHYCKVDESCPEQPSDSAGEEVSDTDIESFIEESVSKENTYVTQVALRHYMGVMADWLKRKKLTRPTVSEEEMIPVIDQWVRKSFGRKILKCEYRLLAKAIKELNR